MKKILAIFFLITSATFTVNSAELKFVCYQDINECDTIAELAKPWEASTGHKLNIETVGYEVVREQLENQLESGAAPDLARVTNLGGLNKFYLDLKPYVDNSYWETNYGQLYLGIESQQEMMEFMVGRLNLL